MRCARCGEVIGGYEPLIYIDGGTAHRTSRAAEPELIRAGQGSCYHARCHELD